MKELDYQIKLNALVPIEGNPRTIDEASLGRLATLIREHTVALADWNSSDGFRLVTTLTINRNGNRIVGGHQRIKALQMLGQDWIHKADITLVDIPPESAHEKALCIALNSEDASGQWNYEGLAGMLEEINTDGFELDLTGLAPHTFEPLLAADWQPPAVDPDYNPDPMVAPGGDIPMGESVKLTQEQREVFERAVGVVRAEGGADLSEGRCLELVCGDYLAGQ